MSTVTRQTRLIHAETNTYPLFLSDMARYAPHTVFGPTTDTDTLIEFGIEIVNEVPAPVADIVTEGPPAEVAGEWHQTWVARSFNDPETSQKLEDAKRALRSSAEAMRVTQFEQGFPHTFGADVYHVQIRNTDRTNLLGLRAIAKEVVTAGRDMTFSFRVYENVVVDITAAEMVAVADAAFAATTVGYAKAWAVKDGADTATMLAELPGLPDPATFFTA